MLFRLSPETVSIDSDCYSKMLIEELQKTSDYTQRTAIQGGVVVLHDSARPHTFAHTVDTSFWDIIVSSYSPGLVPLNFHLLGPLKAAQRGKILTSDEEVKIAVYSWVAAQPKAFSK